MTGNLSRERKSLTARALEHREAGQAAFLKALAEVGTVTAACLTSGVGRRTVYADLNGSSDTTIRAWTANRLDRPPCTCRTTTT